MLSDAKLRALKPTDKIQTVSDGRGLCFIITPQGGRGWRMRYRFGGKPKMISLGTYPEVGLANAREKLEELRKLIASGIDPSAKRHAEKTRKEDTFDALFDEFYSIRKQEWNEAHAVRNLRRYEIHAKEFIGQMSVADINAPKILEILKRIQLAGTLETAHRVKGVLAGAFDYAIALGKIQINPCGGLSKSIVRPPENHYPAPITPEDIGRLTAMSWDYSGTPIVRAALRMAPYLFCRPGELRRMRWSEIEGNIWRRRVSKIKTDLLTPLPLQVLGILKDLHPISGHGVYVFPNARTANASRPMSEGAVLAAYRRIGITGDELVGHSWRATARTICDEELKFSPDVIEHAIGHKVIDPMGRAYNRTTHLNERFRLAQEWADWLDNARNQDQAPHS